MYTSFDLFLRPLINRRKRKIKPKIIEIVAQGAQPPIMIEKEFVSGIRKRVPRIQVKVIKTEAARKFLLTPKYPAISQAKTSKKNNR